MKYQTRADYGDAWTRWDALLQKEADAQHVPFEWLKAICMNESSLGLHPAVARGLEAPWDIITSKSEDGKSYGLMQMCLPTARDYDLIATPEKLNNPEYAIHLGARHVARLLRRLEAQEEWVIKAYNEGANAAILEKAGRIPGRANEYWNRYLTQKALLKEDQAA